MSTELKLTPPSNYFLAFDIQMPGLYEFRAGISQKGGKDFPTIKLPTEGKVYIELKEIDPKISLIVDLTLNRRSGPYSTSMIPKTLEITDPSKNNLVSILMKKVESTGFLYRGQPCKVVHDEECIDVTELDKSPDNSGYTLQTDSEENKVSAYDFYSAFAYD